MTHSGCGSCPKGGLTLAAVLERVQRTTKKSMSNSTCNTCSSQTSLAPSSTATSLKYPSPPQQSTLNSALSSRSYVTKGCMRLRTDSTGEATSRRTPQQKKQQIFERRRGLPTARRDSTVERIKPNRLAAARGRSPPGSSALGRSNLTVGSQRTSYKSIKRGTTTTVLSILSQTQVINYWPGKARQSKVKYS